MADLTEGQSAQTIKVVGATGAVESANFLIVNADGSINTTASVTSSGVEQHIIDSAGDLYIAGTTKGILSLSRVVGAAPSLTAGQFSGLTLDTAGNLRIVDRHARLNALSDVGASGYGIMGSDGTVLRWLKVDTSGALVISAVASPNTFFSFGDIAVAVIAEFAVRRTTYTEPAANAQRSMSSSSALDTAAGTGARTVRITYFDTTGAGPFTETITLNGTTFVNTVATDIRFIEKMEVITVGSTRSNAGIITLFGAVSAGGGTVGTIAATNKQTFWCHHYIATGKKMNVTGISVSHNGTTVGSGGVFHIRSIPIGVTNVPEIQISDFVRLYGQSSTFARNYDSPIRVIGPARVIMYLTPESSTSVTFRASLDYFEE